MTKHTYYYSCGFCEKTFKKEGFLLRHFFNHSGGVKPLSCENYKNLIAESCLLKKHNLLVYKRRNIKRLTLKIQERKSFKSDRNEFIIFYILLHNLTLFPKLFFFMVP